MKVEGGVVVDERSTPAGAEEWCESPEHVHKGDVGAQSDNPSTKARAGAEERATTKKRSTENNESNGTRHTGNPRGQANKRKSGDQEA